MPNYNITIDSRFDPYSFEDYLKPLAILQEQHNQAADAYATALANSAGLYDALKANAEDAEAAKYVNDYENSLNALASDLATNGLNRTNRRGVYETKAKTGYIEKLKKAIDNRNTFIAQQNELAAADPTRRFSDYAYNHGITRFLNPDFAYGSFSEAAIQKQVEDTVKYLAKSTYLRDPNNPQFKHIAGLTKLMQESTGARPEEIDAAMQAIMSGQPLDEKQSKIAQMLYNDAMDIATQHLGNWSWDNDARQAAYVAASKGLYSALGTEENKIFNIDEPRESGSGSSKSFSAPDISGDWYNLVWSGDSVEDRTGLGAFKRAILNNDIKTFIPEMEKILNTNGPISTTSNGKNYHNLYEGDSSNAPEWMQQLLGLRSNSFTGPDGQISSDPLKGVDKWIDYAQTMGMSKDVIEDLNKLNDRIKNGQKLGSHYTEYQAKKTDLEPVKKVIDEYMKRRDEYDALQGLAFGINLDKNETKDIAQKLIGSMVRKNPKGPRGERFIELKEVSRFDSDGNVVAKDSNGIPTSEFQKLVDSSKRINIYGMPYSDKNNITRIHYVMEIDGRKFIIPENSISENKKISLNRGVNDYLQAQLDYDAWKKNVDLNNMTPEQYLQYQMYNQYLGDTEQSLFRRATFAIRPQNWKVGDADLIATNSEQNKIANKYEQRN